MLRFLRKIVKKVKKFKKPLFYTVKYTTIYGIGYIYIILNLSNATGNAGRRKETKMTVTKAQSMRNRKEVREYWYSYLHDGHIMGWLFVDNQGDVWGEYEPQGQSYKVYGEDRRVVHEFGDFYRAHGELPKITLRDFTAELGINDYLGKGAIA